MAVRRYYRDPPKQQPVVDGKARVTLSWSQYFTDAARPGHATDVDISVDPPNLGIGVATRVNVPAQGARQGNFVSASFDQSTDAVALFGWVSAADQITVLFWNVSGGAVDLPAGTLRVRFWSHNP